MTRELRVCHLEELEEGQSLRVEAHGGLSVAVALHRIGDEVYATDDTCTHEEWSLGDDGELEGHEIVCCLHLAAFDVRDGKPTRFPATIPLKVYPVRVVDGEIWIGL